MLMIETLLRRWVCVSVLAVVLMPGLWPVDAAAHGEERSPAQTVCSTLHGLVAERRQSCCGGTKAGDLAAVCDTRLALALERGALTLDEAALRRCGAELSEQLRGCDWVGALPPPLPASCLALVHGARDAGARCETSLECADGLYCRGAAIGSAGVCARPEPVGGRCEIPDDPLASLLHARDDPRHASCVGSCIRGQCIARTSVGSACATSATCAAGLSCRDQVCRGGPGGANGDVCSAGDACAAGLVCSDGKCAAPGAAGATCRLPFECRSLQCDKAAGEAVGRCTEACTGAAPSVFPGAPLRGAKLF
jgi:hypothetical protein